MAERKRNENGDMNVRWGKGVPERLEAMRADLGLRSVGELARSVVLPALAQWETQRDAERAAKAKRGK